MRRRAAYRRVGRSARSRAVAVGAEQSSEPAPPCLCAWRAVNIEFEMDLSCCRRWQQMQYQSGSESNTRHKALVTLPTKHLTPYVAYIMRYNKTRIAGCLYAACHGKARLALMHALMHLWERACARAEPSCRWSPEDHWEHESVDFLWQRNRLLY